MNAAPPPVTNGTEPACPEPVRSSQEPVHWVGDAPTSLHGNGAASFDQTSRDVTQITCALCRALLARTAAGEPWKVRRSQACSCGYLGKRHSAHGACVDCPCEQFALGADARGCPYTDCGRPTRRHEDHEGVFYTCTEHGDWDESDMPDVSDAGAPETIEGRR